MTRLSLIRAVTVVLAVMSAGHLAWTQDESTKTLLEAWERAQRDDPATIALEPIETRLYRFHTNRFPYDGRLRVLNLSVDDTGYGPGMPYKLGFVEVELVDASEDFPVKFAQSYSLWQARNTLYFDEEAGEWLSSHEWQNRMIEQVEPVWPALLLSNWVWIALLAIFIVVVWKITRRATRQFDSAMHAQDKALTGQDHAIKLTEHAVKIHEDSNRLLGEILAELRSGRS
ncbi:MAG: hypothetical protein OEQ13_07320 [Acidobacteriota bacterium]|nr:hypothetical protein [Acidobacteriota bacterium]